MNQKTQINIVYIIFAVIGVLTLQSMWVQYRSVEPLAYSEFLGQLKAGNVQDIAIAANVIQGTLKKPLPDGRKQFVTTRVDPELAKDLDAYGVKFTGVIESTFFKDLLGWIVPALVFAGIWFFLIRRLQGRAGVGPGLLAIGKSKAKVYVETEVKVTFEDVAGVDEAKEELKEVVGFLKDPTRYGRLGARLPKGVLLVGPPGTGKTLLARAVAGEAGVPFFSINGSEFVEMFVGVGAARVRDLFEEARKKAPAIIFIDEIDALGRARGAYGIGGHDEKEQTLNQLLAELDGFDPKSGLVLIGATNRPEVLDPALLRAGRFDRTVVVDRPDRSGRVQILRVHAKKVTLAQGVDLDQVAALTPGFSGADLANLVNEAALQATRSNHQQVELDDFTVAIERIVAGLEKRSRVLSASERTVVAHHEMGHALVATALPGQDPVQKVSIIPRGIGALGYTLQRPIEDRYLMSRTELENKMATLLGGRAAEHLVFGELSTGAADDLAKATQIARSMVARYGMDPTLGPVVYEQERAAFLATDGISTTQRSYSEQTAREIDVAARNLVEAAFTKSVKILTERRNALERGAQRLLQKETLADPELKELLAAP
ncbi:MAG TPA: ATP-dependent zinc metalloprotease FtsH [Burkholderiaceae bacterium]|jgi:cell division protease FtsH|nr:ATP-dependent zinc metalloprotease FtsH [Burkholderiaceae bacterium]